MLAKAFSYSRAQLNSHSTRALLGVASRGVYKAGTEPKVFVNKHTKVITQGITGKHVSERDRGRDANHHLNTAYSLITYIGYFPHPTGHQLRHKDGWRC